MTGHCLCGRVSWSTDQEATSVHHCHCRMCRRWSGGAFATLVWFKTDSVRWTGTLPKLNRSSPIAQRSHCETCGSPIHLVYDDSDTIAMAAGTVDHPEALRPTHHYGTESRLTWSDLALDLPGESTREQWQGPASRAPLFPELGLRVYDIRRDQGRSERVSIKMRGRIDREHGGFPERAFLQQG